MSKEKQKLKKEIEKEIENFNKVKINKKSGITKQEWEKIKNNIELTPKQRELYTGIRNNILTIVQGPAGTSKTFTSCLAAIGLLADRKVERIILSKPIQESGENLGFLPGTIEEKTDPYMQSYFTTFKKILGNQIFEFMRATGEIVVQPIAYMRGVTYDNCIMLLDEAQNCNMQQLMLWITRLGKNSKAVMMGDISQYDIKKKDSKFLDFINLVIGKYDFKIDGFENTQDYKKMLDGVYYQEFDKNDIVRNKFLIDLVDRYERYKFQNNI